MIIYPILNIPISDDDCKSALRKKIIRENALTAYTRNQRKSGYGRAVFITPSKSTCKQRWQHGLKVKKSLELILWSSCVKIMKSVESAEAELLVLSSKRHPKNQ